VSPAMDAPPRPARAPSASFDSVILAAVLAECRGPAEGARVGRALQPGPADLTLGLRAGGRPSMLRLSLDPRWTRLVLVHGAPVGEVTPFAQMLRSRLEGATIREIGAPPFERVVAVAFDTLEGPQELIVELMGRFGNLILCARGAVVGALRAADRRHGRSVTPGRGYERPPSPAHNPLTVSPADLLAPPDATRTVPGGPAPAWRAVMQRAGGLGPAHAWEVCLRAGVDPALPLEPDAAARAAAAAHELGRAVMAGAFTPTLYRDARGEPVAYGAFPMRLFAGMHAEPASMSAAVEAVVGRASALARVEDARKGLAATVAQAGARVARALGAVADDERAAADADRLREHGQLILAYLAQVAPGASDLEVPGHDGRPVRIGLDPALSPVQNAQAYFRRHARAQAARRRLPDRRAALESERAYLDATAAAIAQAESADDLWEIEQDLVAAGLRRRARPAAMPRATDAGRAFDLPGGFRARVGRSARENERLTFDVAGPDDLWLHARGMPGAHVILITGGRAPSHAALASAAALAAYYSAGRRAAKVPVDMTTRRHVRRVRGGRPGQVTYAHERTLLAVPRLPSPRDTSGEDSR
jgi:predicted ribosome quality control (RQC) complex YloA/Tae2 family protein